VPFNVGNNQRAFFHCEKHTYHLLSSLPST
jgi:hypothetical protein